MTPTFRNADGTICCSGKYLCDKCKERARVPDPYHLVRPLVSSAHDYTPPDGYQIALAKRGAK